MTAILAIDPGPVQSGWCLLVDGRPDRFGIHDNAVLIEGIGEIADRLPTGSCTLAIEMIASYGMAVGKDVFETCVWVGRYVQEWHDEQNTMLVYRKDVKLHLCGSPRAKDANIRQALIDMFPATGGGKVPQIGTKKQPGPLFGVTSHVWPALGVAVTAAHQLSTREGV